MRNMSRNVPLELMILQFAEGIQKLVQNPDLSKIIEASYTLSDAEQAKINAAYDTVAKADEIRVEFKKREDVLSALNDRIAQEESLKEENSEALRDIASQQSAANTQKAANDKDAKANKGENQRLEDLRLELQDWKEELAAEQKEVDAMKSDLKKRAETLTAGL